MRKLTDTAASAALLALVAALLPVPNAHAAAVGDPRPAAPTAASSCGACHGSRGEGNAAGGLPRLQGLPAAYQIRQLEAYADGTRQSAVMAPLARALGARERAELSNYYADLEAPAHPSGSVATAHDDRLALHGRWSQEIPACVQCHGRNGVGIGAAFPPLAAQPAAYLTAQLRAWQQGTRRGEPLGLMQRIAGTLSDADVTAVADYFSAIAADGTPPARAPAAATAREKAPLDASRTDSGGRAGGQGVFTPADVPIPDDGFGQVVRLGRDIFDDPGRFAGRFVGNDLRCTSCHLDEGRRVGSAPMWAAYVSYPAFRAKNGHVNTYAERLQGCFAYSMNGRAPPLGDPVLVALESYSYWMARGAPLDPNIAGRGYPKVPKPALAPDRARGAAVFEAKCALCHGTRGEGRSANDGSPGFPALWGAGSYNWGAGMVNVTNAAGFIKGNMPFSLGNSLTDQEAWDVALFVDSHERPQDPRYTGSVETTRARFHDGDNSLYGQRVDGYLLGSKSVPPGRRPRQPAATAGGG
ncbi:MAG TPA: c-type cytochrome [Steroidobacteraceae bacterium]|nr:c-type cytochrome [Steroidobacteraceae bacterium]